MEISDLRVGDTYRGAFDYKRGLGTHRTIFDIDGKIVLFRVEGGETPPACYVSHASMAKEDFAAWAEARVPAPGA